MHITVLWFPASDCDFRWFESDFQSFCVKLSQKHCGRNKIDQGCPCRTEFILMSLYSTEITRYCLWFLDYKLTVENSVPQVRPWRILYFTNTGTIGTYHYTVQYQLPLICWHWYSNLSKGSNAKPHSFKSQNQAGVGGMRAASGQ